MELQPSLTGPSGVREAEGMEQSFPGTQDTRRTGTKLLLHFAGHLADLPDLLPPLGKACRFLFGTLPFHYFHALCASKLYITEQLHTTALRVVMTKTKGRTAGEKENK